MSQTVNKETLLQDIENTRQELQAYRQIAAGFRALAKLPEAKAKGKINTMKALGFESNARQCQAFLTKLENLAQELGLKP